MFLSIQEFIVILCSAVLLIWIVRDWWICTHSCVFVTISECKTLVRVHYRVKIPDTYYFFNKRPHSQIYDGLVITGKVDDEFEMKLKTIVDRARDHVARQEERQKKKKTEFKVCEKMIKEIIARDTKNKVKLRGYDYE